MKLNLTRKKKSGAPSASSATSKPTTAPSKRSVLALQASQYSRKYGAGRKVKKGEKASSAAAITVNGEPILEAKADDVHTFLDALQQGIKVSMDEGNDGDLSSEGSLSAAGSFESTSDSVSLDESVETSGDKDYDAMLGKSFRNLRRSLAKAKKTSKAKMSLGRGASSKLASAAPTKKVETVKEEDTVAGDSTVEPIEDVSLDGMTTVVEVLDDASAEASIPTDAVAVVEVVEETAPKAEEEAPVEEAPLEAPLEEIEAPLEEIEAPLEEIEAPLEEIVSIPAEEGATPEVDEAASSPKEEALPFEETNETPVESANKEEEKANSAKRSPAAMEDYNLEPNIEAVEQGDDIILGFYQPLPEGAGGEDEYGGIDYSAVVFNLSLMVDGAVVQTIALGAAGMELLSRCIPDNKETKEENDLVSEVVEEEDCAKGRITSLTVDTDLIPEEEVTRDTAAEPEQSFIHPMIMEKLNGFIDQAKTAMVQSASGSNTKTETDVFSEAEQSFVPVMEKLNDSAETVEKGWFETNLEKAQAQAINLCPATLDGIAPDEDNRNDSAEQANPALNEEVRC